MQAHPALAPALDRLEREWGTSGAGLAVWAPSLTGDDQAVAAYLRLLRSGVSPGSARSLARAAYSLDWEAVLPAVRVPTLVLQCSADVIAPDVVGQYVHEHIPGSVFTRLTATGHVPNLSAPEETTRAIRAFLTP